MWALFVHGTAALENREHSSMSMPIRLEGKARTCPPRDNWGGHLFILCALGYQAAMELDYEGLFAALNQAGIRYLLTGGVAVNFHGLPRMTFDVDLIVLFEKDNLEKLTALLEGLGYRSRLPVPASGLADPATRKAWQRDKGLLAYTFMHPSQPMAEVDVMLDAPAPFEELMARAVNVPFGRTTVPLLSRQDLIATKQGSPRQQDICDVEALRRLGSNP